MNIIKQTEGQFHAFDLKGRVTATPREFALDRRRRLPVKSTTRWTMNIELKLNPPGIAQATERLSTMEREAFEYLFQVAADGFRPRAPQRGVPAECMLRKSWYSPPCKA